MTLDESEDLRLAGPTFAHDKGDHFDITGGMPQLIGHGRYAAASVHGLISDFPSSRRVVPVIGEILIAQVLGKFTANVRNREQSRQFSVFRHERTVDVMLRHVYEHIVQRLRQINNVCL